MAVMVSNSEAQVQVSTEELARRLVSEGVEAARDRSWIIARERFGRAYSIQPHPLTLYNLATTQEKTGMYVEADRSYRIFLRETASGEYNNFRTAAIGRRASLRKKVALIVLEIQNLQSKDILRLGQETISHAVIGSALPANPGPIEISVERANTIIMRQTKVIESGLAQSIQIELPEPPSDVPSLQALTPSQLPSSQNSVVNESSVTAELKQGSHQRRKGLLSSPWFWVAVGTAVVAGTTAGLFVALGPDEPFDSNLRPVTLSGR
ncbi:MAG: hypothetical protein KTR25_07070 [Myxococcales bacterium]|nr:hypothetical protein [Myxococcales bacterium]